MNRSILVLILVLLPFVKTFGQNKIDLFWNDINANEIEIGKLPIEDKIYQLNSMIKKIDTGLLIEFSNNESTLSHLVLSADGNKALFALVDKIMSSPKKSEIFNFIGLRQASPNYTSFEIEGKEIVINDMTFIPQEMDNGLFVAFIHSNKTKDIDRAFLENYGMNTIDYLIGEKKYAEEIQDFEFLFEEDLENPNFVSLQDNEVFPLAALSSYLEQRKVGKIKSDLEVLLTSGEWFVKEVDYKGKKEPLKIENNKWTMLFHPNGTLEVFTNGMKSHEKWTLNNEKKSLYLSVGKNIEEFNVEKINDKKIILSAMINGENTYFHIERE